MSATGRMRSRFAARPAAGYRSRQLGDNSQESTDAADAGATRLQILPGDGGAQTVPFALEKSWDSIPEQDADAQLVMHDYTPTDGTVSVSQLQTQPSAWKDPFATQVQSTPGSAVDLPGWEGFGITGQQQAGAVQQVTPGGVGGSEIWSEDLPLPGTVSSAGGPASANAPAAGWEQSVLAWLGQPLFTLGGFEVTYGLAILAAGAIWFLTRESD